ncbi:MAG TPA: amino acid ABC transporter permease [bacterium]|nr:amino acid ABC transporter permease [bacterium]
MWHWPAFFGNLVSPYLLAGAWTTLWLSTASMGIGLCCGLVAALMRLSSKPMLNLPAFFYIWLMRGTPVLVQLIIIFTALPQIGIRLNVVQSALLGLGLNEGAYLAEIIRSGILAVPKGQFDAARSVGMPFPMMMRLIVLPQALRVIIPPLGNTFNSLLKTSSLASVISMDELLRRSEVLIQLRFEVLEILMVAALYYLVFTTVWGLIQARIEAHFSRSVTPYHGARPGPRRPGPAEQIEQTLLAHDAQ